MRRAVRVGLWVAVFAGCAGIGALLASHTNPFPPGVEDPGVRASIEPTHSRTVAPGTVRHWKGEGSTATYHDLFVGGRCSTAWRLALRFTIDDRDRASGTGTARLAGRLRCAFHTAQVQARTVRLTVGGHREGDLIDLALSVGSVSPSGSDDYGGLTHTLQRFPSVQIRAGAGRSRTRVRVPDGDQGTYGAAYDIRLACADC